MDKKGILVIKTVLLVKKQIDQWNKTESKKYTHINIVNRAWKKAQRQYNGAKTGFSTNGARKTAHPYTQKC